MVLGTHNMRLIKQSEAEACLLVQSESLRGNFAGICLYSLLSLLLSLRAFVNVIISPQHLSFPPATRFKIPLQPPGQWMTMT